MPNLKEGKFILVLLIYVLISSCAGSDLVPESKTISIVPKPSMMEVNDGNFKFTAKTTISSSQKNQEKAVRFLNEMFEKAAGFSMPINQEKGRAEIIFKDAGELADEAYKLTIDPHSITIEAADESGYFYAVQTIRQLLPKEIESKEVVETSWVVPCLSIMDEPRFKWRGMHNDFSRHFFNVDEVKRFLDYMALYKLNTYHMHLTDDQGWRLEIKKYPLLTEKGAWRLHNNQDSLCIERSKENDLYKIDESNYKTIDGKRMYGGFFTQDQMKDIISYADDRAITIIPEIDMPGHLKSAIDNYPYLSCDNKSGWATVFTFPACLGKSTTYDFMKDVLAEVAKIFPAEYIHIGGDEVNIKSWEKCNLCQGVIAEEGLADEHELQSFFNRDIEEFLHSKGKKLMGWDEIVEGGLTEDASVMWWRNWRPEAPVKAVENGNNLVVTTTAAYYFDYLNEGVSLANVYNYEPMPKMIGVDQQDLVLGLQANLWSERIANFKRLQYQAFPRILAVAENGWASNEDKNFKEFNARVAGHYSRLDMMDTHYYIPAVEGLNRGVAMVDSASVELHLAYDAPDVDIHYTLDGSLPTPKSTKYTQPFVISDTLNIRARAYRGAIFNDTKSAKAYRLIYRNPVDHSPKEEGLKRYLIKGKFKTSADLSISDDASYESVDSIDIAEFKNKKGINLIFKSYFHADQDAVYEFETRSDGGDHLYIGDELVVDNSGWHGPRRRHGKIALKQGWHPIKIKYRPSDNPRVIKAWYAKQGESLIPLSGDAVSF